MIIGNNLDSGTLNPNSKFVNPQSFNLIRSSNNVYRPDLISFNTLPNTLPPDPFDPNNGQNPPVNPPESHNTNLKMAALFGIPAIVLGAVGYAVGAAMGSAFLGAAIGAILGPAAVMGYITFRYFTS